MAKQDTVPFEASYEAAKQSIIRYMGEVSHAYDIPIPLLNILIYEIALESRNASFSAIVGGCEVTYPEQNTPTEAPVQAPKTQTMPKEKALKEIEKMGIPVDKKQPSTSKSA